MHQSHPLATTTAVSCQRRSAAAEDEGRSAKPRLTVSVLSEGNMQKGVGGFFGNRTSGSHLDQREAHGSGTGRRLSMPKRKLEVTCAPVFICMFLMQV